MLSDKTLLDKDNPLEDQSWEVVTAAAQVAWPGTQKAGEGKAVRQKEGPTGPQPVFQGGSEPARAAGGLQPHSLVCIPTRAE